MFAGAGMMAADGRCKTLDAAADGYVRGEAVVLIKLWCVSVPLRHLVSFNLQELPLQRACSHLSGSPASSRLVLGGFPCIHTAQVQVTLAVQSRLRSR